MFKGKRFTSFSVYSSITIIPPLPFSFDILSTHRKPFHRRAHNTVRPRISRLRTPSTRQRLYRHTALRGISCTFGFPPLHNLLNFGHCLPLQYFSKSSVQVLQHTALLWSLSALACPSADSGFAFSLLLICDILEVCINNLPIINKPPLNTRSQRPVTLPYTAKRSMRMYSRLSLSSALKPL